MIGFLFSMFFILFIYEKNIKKRRREKKKQKQMNFENENENNGKTIVFGRKKKTNCPKIIKS